MSDYALALKTAPDLVHKLGREMERFNQSVRDRDELHASDHLFNFAVTAWHVVDWIWKTDPTSGTSLRELRDLQDNLKNRCPSLAVCQDLANGGKHFTITMYAPTATKAARGKVRRSGIGRPIGQPIGQPIGEPISAGWWEECYVIQMADGKTLKAADMMAQAISFWEHELGI